MAKKGDAYQQGLYLDVSLRFHIISVIDCSTQNHNNKCAFYSLPSIVGIMKESRIGNSELKL